MTGTLQQPHWANHIDNSLMKQHNATAYTKHHCEDHPLSEAEMFQNQYASVNLQNHQPG